MVLPKFFGRALSSPSLDDKTSKSASIVSKTDKHKSSESSGGDTKRPLSSRTGTSTDSGTGTRPSSPEKKSTLSSRPTSDKAAPATTAATVKERAKDQGRKEVPLRPIRTSQRLQDQKQQQRPQPRQGKSSSTSATKTSHYPDEHPLNLPPEELRRLSRLSRQSPYSHSRSIMADEQNGVQSPTPSSTPPPPQTNGADGQNESDKDSAPAPPPHRTPASPPPPPVDAEACKAAGNKFFKAREYEKAIQEYSKGTL